MRILAVFGSPRRNGNTDRLLKRAVAGAREAGAEVEEIVLRELNISPCLELYGCRKTGRCVIEDDFQGVYDRLVEARGILLASPIFFYTVSAHTKILMDRCQSFWVRKYLIEGRRRAAPPSRKGVFIAAGATRGKRLFEGALLAVRYFLDVLDAELVRSVLVRGVDAAGEVEKDPASLAEAYDAGRYLVRLLES